jgi:hypothetical protein
MRKHAYAQVQGPPYAESKDKDTGNQDYVTLLYMVTFLLSYTALDTYTHNSNKTGSAITRVLSDLETTLVTAIESSVCTCTPPGRLPVCTPPGRLPVCTPPGDKGGSSKGAKDTSSKKKKRSRGGDEMCGKGMDERVSAFLAGMVESMEREESKCRCGLWTSIHLKPCLYIYFIERNIYAIHSPFVSLQAAPLGCEQERIYSHSRQRRFCTFFHVQGCV